MIPIDTNDLMRPTKNIVSQVAQPVQEQTQGNFLDQITKLAETVERIVSKGEFIEGVFHKVMKKTQQEQQQKKNDSVQSQPQPRTETVVNAPTVQQEEKKQMTYNQPQQPTQAPATPELTTELLEQLIKKLIEKIKSDVPEDWQNKTIKEIMIEYEKLEGMKKHIVLLFMKEKITALSKEKIGENNG